MKNTTKMAHTSNTIYRDTANNLGISIADIQTVLVSSSNDIGGLITSGDIKKWAKYKPYRSSSLITSETARRAAHYGLSVQEFTELGTPTSTSQNCIIPKLIDGTAGWEYLRPRGKAGGQGGANEWFRFFDFDGYYHDAVCPVGEPITSIYVTGGTAQIAWDLLDNLDSGNLTLSDIYIGDTQLTEYYLGILLYRSDSNYRIVTSDNILGTGDVQITISDFPQSDLGDWRAYPFFSSVQIPYIDPQYGPGSYVSAGWDTGYINLHFISSSQTLSFYAWGVWRDNTHTVVDVDWYAYNEVSAARTVQPTLVLMYAAEGRPAAEGSSAAQVSLGTVTVPAKSGDAPGEASGSITITRPSQIAYDDYVWWLGIVVQGYTTNYEQIEEPEYEEE